MLIVIAWVSIALAVGCAFWIALDEMRHPQPMAIMNVVWPVTALYFSVLAVWAYYRLGRHHEHHEGPPTAAQVAVGTSHCGAGCMLADLLCEFLIGITGIILLGSVLLTSYIVDLAAAWVLGIAFQYFAIKPMSALSPGQALLAAIKADTFSILAFQVGMYAWMALVYLRLFTHPHLTPFQPQYWLMMQLGMICGFFTSYPMNAWLLRTGRKEAM